MIKEAKEFIDIMVQSFYIMYQIAIAKDPCKKCLVRPCCSEWCSERKIYVRLMLGYDSMIFAKTISYFSFSSLAFSLITFIKITFFD